MPPSMGLPSTTVSLWDADKHTPDKISPVTILSDSMEVIFDVLWDYTVSTT